MRVPRVEERLGSAHMCSVCSWPPGEPHGAGPRIVRAARLKPQRVSLGESQPAAPEELTEGGEGCRSQRERGWVRGVLLRFSPSSAACLMFRDETEAWLHLKTLKVNEVVKPDEAHHLLDLDHHHVSRVQTFPSVSASFNRSVLSAHLEPFPEVLSCFSSCGIYSGFPGLSVVNKDFRRLGGHRGPSRASFRTFGGHHMFPGVLGGVFGTGLFQVDMMV